MEIIRGIEQGTPEWFALRIGSIGGSSISDVVAGGKGKSRASLMYRLASEILTGVKSDGPNIKYAERGHEFEAEARDLYAFEREVEVEQVALVRDGAHKHYSPDGLVGENGLIEIKVRLPHVYLEALETGVSPLHDRRQVQWGLHLTGRKYCDYILFCPEMHSRPMHVEQIGRDEKMIAELEYGADKFIAEMLAMVERWK